MARIALIDGDTVAYYACRPRHPINGKDSFVKLSDADRTDHEPMNTIKYDENGKKIPLVYTPAQDRVYLEQSWNNFKKDTTALISKVKADDFMMAVKSSFNFRDDIYSEYKQHRKKTPENNQYPFVPTLRKLAIKEGLAIEAYGREADDMIRIWSNEVTLNGDTYVICTIDKDMKCIPGEHYNLKHKEFFEMSEADSRRFYYEQLIKGDPTDNIPGIPGWGPVKATEWVAWCQTEDDYQEAVAEAYLGVFGDEWKDYLLANGKMIHLQAHPEDYFNLQDWPVAQAL